jgi:hypothetical protein
MFWFGDNPDGDEKASHRDDDEDFEAHHVDLIFSL